MKKFFYILSLLILVTACGPSTDEAAAKKARLDEARKEMASLKAEIASLEKELGATAGPSNAILVSPLSIGRQRFEHFIEVRGTVESRTNVLLSSQTGGKVEVVAVKEGQRVSKGQLLVALDADVVKGTLAELQTQLNLAKITLEKQEKLWSQKIGTEMQYLQAKNQKEALESRIAATEAQLNQMTIRAPFSGVVDQVEARVGENAGPGSPLVRMVSQDETYLSVDISENFIGKFSAGDKATILFPVQNKTVSSRINAVGQVINPENRTFEVEVDVPSSLGVKPNQVAVVTIRDYVNPNAIAVPTKYIQRDNRGQYVYQVTEEEGKAVAKKLYIETGISYNGVTEVTTGITDSVRLVGEGFRDITDGAEIHVHQQENKEVANN